jgi:hypothetical protein
VLVKISGRVVQGKRHMRAAEALEKQCISHKLNKDGLKHLKKLLTEKSYVSYGSQRIAADEARTLSTSAERFEAWAMQTLRRLEALHPRAETLGLAPSSTPCPSTPASLPASPSATSKIAPATVLAPMAGVTDTVFRRFIKNASQFTEPKASAFAEPSATVDPFR